MPRVVSLIASATEIVAALGCEEQLVGRSHECDFPASVRRLPVCTAPKLDIEADSGEIDRQVKALVQQETSVYRVHADVLRQLRPEVIVTQSQCAVCAVSLRDVEQALGDWRGPHPRLVSLSPNGLTDVWANIRQVADALGVAARGEQLVGMLSDRLVKLEERVRLAPERPTVACLEWLDPLMAAGNWVPELVEKAGGIDLFGRAGKHSPVMTGEQLVTKDPEVIVAMPCGLDLARTCSEMASLVGQPGWEQMRAVRSGRVYATDGNQFFNRPGPRLVESAEILAELLHPGLIRVQHGGSGWQRWAGPAPGPGRNG